MNCCTPPNVCGGAVPNAQCSAPDHPEPTLTATLTASPTSGTTQTTFTFTAWIGGAKGGTAASYTRPSCGTDGTIVPGSHTGHTDNTFQCTYTTPGDKTAAISAARAGVGARRPTATVTVTDPTPTLTASLSASPTSGTTQDTFTFTATRTGGNATGAVTFTNPQCGAGGTLVAGSWANNTDNTFQCTFTAGTRTASMTVSQGGASTSPTASVTVTAPTITASLSASPASGTTQTIFTFTAARTGGNAIGAVTFTNPQCGTGGTLVTGSYTGHTDNTFQCTYATAGTRTARMTVSQGTPPATTTPSVTISVRLLLTVNRIGLGTVQSSIPENVINCGPTCSAEFSLGDSVTLTATPGEGHVFDSWRVTNMPNECPGTGTCRVTMDRSHTVTARFAPLISHIEAPEWVRQEAPFNITVNTALTSTCTLTSTANDNRTAGPGTSLIFSGLTQTAPVIYHIQCTHTHGGVTTTDTETRRVNVMPRFGEF